MCKRRSVVYLANWTWYEIARGVFATATNEGGAKFNFGPPLRGSVRSPHKKVKANLFWGALGQPLKKQPSGGWSKRLTWSSKKSVGQLVTPRCYKLAYWFEQRVNNCYVFVLLDLFRGGWCLPVKDDLLLGQPTHPANIWTVWARPAVEDNKKPEKNIHEASFLTIWISFL